MSPRACTAMFREKSDVKLIRLVKENPVLYDSNDAKYMDCNSREVAWQKIGDELKKPAADCKIRWVNIRDVHRRILRKSILGLGKQSRAYKYENEMSFMRRFYRDISFPAGETEEKESWNVADNDAIEDDPDSEDSEVPVKKKRKSRKSSRKEIYLDFEDEKQVAYNDQPQSEVDSTDSVDAFLLSIGATLKTFSPYHLNLAKSKIFSVVQEHELQQIVQKNEGSLEAKVSTSDHIQEYESII